jgi:murein L,D-transpeptidase YafK
MKLPAIVAIIFFLLLSIVVSASPFKVIVKKSERKLYLYKNDSLQQTYKIALGLNPIGSKVKQGDYKTPEGEYYICSKNDHSQFYLALGLSYPNKSDAELGFRSGLITRTQYNAIISAIDHHKKPPMNTPLGGDIMIHGFGTARDWTWGCVALENANIKALFDLLPIGTVVVIEP